MKAAVIEKFGGPEVIKIKELEKPFPRFGEVIIKVKAVSLNHLDIWVREGLTAYGTKLPHILGCDFAGEIVELGDGIENFKIGDKVFVDPGLRCFKCEFCIEGKDNLCKNFGIIGASKWGGYAEYAIISEKNLLHIPKGISFEIAAAFPLTYQTSWHMLMTLANLKAGEDVLIIGAASGIGIAAVQISKLAGARVIATVGGENKVGKLISLGADFVINHNSENIYQRVKDITKEKGVDIVFEHVGPATLSDSIKSLKKGGRLVFCGATTGADYNLQLRYIFSRQLSLLGSIMGTRRELLKITELVERGLLSPLIDSVFNLEQVKEAHKRMESRQHVGKIILKID